MTLIRILTKTPHNSDHIYIYNQGLEKVVIDWQFSLEYRVVKSTLKRGMPTLANVLKVCGAHATLWIGQHKGIVAPMDRQPEGWTYGGGQKYEPENYWQWVPDGTSEAQLVNDCNRFSEDPINVILGENNSIFKSMVPVGIERNHGQILAIEGIPVHKLAGMVRQDIDWVFEFERQY